MPISRQSQSPTPSISGCHERRPTDPGEMNAQELLDLYRRHELSPVEATQAALQRIERFNPAVNAYSYVDADGAMAAARASEQRWLIGSPCGSVDGVPASIKDLTLARGMPTRKGSLTTSCDQPWDDDAPLTAHMRHAGAVLLGKTATPEFGWKGVTDSRLTGVTRNPWNTALTPGGSSGGASAAAALNMGVMHQGSDAGGSIRIPCAFTGTFGIKPTFGYVPQWPASAMGTLSHLGPITRTVADSVLMLTVVGRYDSRDWHAGRPSHRDWTLGLGDGIRGLRVAYSRSFGYVNVDAAIARQVDAAVERLAELGAIVEEVDPGFDDPLDTFNTLWFAGAANVVRKLDPTQHEQLDPGFLDIAKRGTQISMAEYSQALDQRVALGEHMARFHQSRDLLVTPTLPIAAFTAGRNAPDLERKKDWTSWAPFSYPFNLTQQPAASVPCGFTPEGLPVGLHIVGPRFRDDLVLRAAFAYECAAPVPYPSAPREDNCTSKH